MDTYAKVLILSVVLLQIINHTQAATKTLDLSKNKYLPPVTSNNNNNNANKSVQQTKTYSSRPQQSIDSFNPRPEIKTTKFPSDPSYPPLFTSYAPPPSGLVSHKNLQLPFSNNIKLPLLLPKTSKPTDLTKHPGFPAPHFSKEEIKLQDSTPMLMIEEPATVLLQPQYNKTIEAAKVLASTFLDTSGLASTENYDKTTSTNTTDLFVVKTQKKAYIIPTHFKKEATKPSAVDDLYPWHDQFEKAYTINQFIFVIKPERLNFLNKLV